MQIIHNADVLLREALNGSIIGANANRNINRGLNNNSVNQSYLVTNQNWLPKLGALNNPIKNIPQIGSPMAKL